MAMTASEFLAYAQIQRDRWYAEYKKKVKTLGICQECLLKTGCGWFHYELRGRPYGHGPNNGKCCEDIVDAAQMLGVSDEI